MEQLRIAVAVLTAALSTACADQPATSPNQPPATTPPGATPGKPDPLAPFESSAFCKEYTCKKGKSWPLRAGGMNNTYDLSAAPHVTVEVPTKDGAIDHYGISFYERERLRNADLQVAYALLGSIDPAGNTEAVRQFIRSNIERPAEQIRRGPSSSFGPYTVWTAKVGETQIVSVERTSDAPTTEPAASAGVSLPVPVRDPASVPADFRDLWKLAASGGKPGEHAGYTYRYAAAGDRAAAIMIPRPVPRNDTLLVGTISDLARRVFSADLSSATPRLEPTPHGGNAIAFRAGRYTYYVLTIKNETQEGAYGPGEPHTLLLWRERS
jgi:hypothetical protein